VEAEYMGFSRATTQALWISKYLSEIGLPTSNPIVIHADNNGSISHSLNDKNHWRIKHINVQYHFIKDQVKWGNITFQYLPSSNNVTDLFTKPLPQEKICQFITKLQLQLGNEGVLDQGECWSGLVTYLHHPLSNEAGTLSLWYHHHTDVVLSFPYFRYSLVWYSIPLLDMLLKAWIHSSLFLSHLTYYMMPEVRTLLCSIVSM